MTNWNSVLLAIAPRGNAKVRAGMAENMQACIDRAELTNRKRLAHFLAQIAHESDGFKTTSEYASGAAYEGRRDLGNMRPGDGKRFKGRGVIQITGRANYETYGRALGVDLVAHPESAADFPVAALTAAEYWKQRHINFPADADDIIAVTKKINGGTNGLASRKEYYARALHALTDLPEALQKTASNIRGKKPKAAPGAVVVAGGAVAEAVRQSGEWQLAAYVLLAAVVVAGAVFLWLRMKNEDHASALEDAANFGESFHV